MTDLSTSIIEEAEAIWYGDANASRRPVPEWAPKEEGGHYLGVSELVKKTAHEYAARIMAQHADEARREDALWGFIGNVLANAVLSPMTSHREVQARIPIQDTGWDLVGHLDGLLVRDNYYIVAEHKARGYVAEDDDEEATRQGTVYLGMIKRMQDAAPIFTLPLASFQADPTARPVTITPELAPWGVATFICPRDGPRSITPTNRQVRARPVAAWMRDKILDFYLRKSQAIILAVEAKDIQPALEWDASVEGLQEFKRTMTSIQAGLDGENLLKVCREYEQAKSAVEQWEAVKDDRSATACAILAQAKEKSVIIITSEGTEAGRATMAGKTGSHYLKWTPKTA